jgi:hypothetical protein
MNVIKAEVAEVCENLKIKIKTSNCKAKIKGRGINSYYLNCT